MKHLIAAAVLISVLASCDAKITAITNQKTKQGAVSFSLIPIALADSSFLPNCGGANDSQLVWVESDQVFYVCKSAQWLTVNTAGPKGDKGEKGDAGEAGIKGDTGATGAAGISGSGIEGLTKLGANFSFAGGNVGIGTTTPSSALDVDGIVRGKGFVGSEGGSSSFNVGVAAYPLAFGWADVNLFHRIRTSGGSNDNLTIDIMDPTNHSLSVNGQFKTLYDTHLAVTSGKVGIGTTSPIAQLHVANGSTGGEATYHGNLLVESKQTDAATNGIEFKASSGSNGYGYRLATIFDGGSAIDFRFQYRHNNASWTSNRLVIAGQSGYVGIGTTTPVATLDVAGFMRLTKNTVAPVVCNASRDGALALKSDYTICVCDGSTWIRTKDGSSCGW